MCFPKKSLLKPLFLQCFLGARFLGQVVKKGKFWTPTQKRRKFSLITEKLIFEYVLFFLFFFSFFVFFFGFFCFVFFFGVSFGGLKGHVRWPEGPPHLALNPPYLFFCFCFVFVFLFFFGVFLLGGFKGQVRWPEGPPHLALNPPYLFVVFLFSWLLFVFFLVPFLSLL